MKKIRITKRQKEMLERKGNALLREDIARSHSPSAKVTDTFKSSGISNFKAEAVEGNTQDVSWSELVLHVHEFIRQIYTNPSKEGLKPFWDDINISWDELISMLLAVDLIKSVKGGYRLTKVVKSPAKAVKIVSKLVEKMINDKNKPVKEIESKDINGDYFKKQIGEPKKSGKTRAQLLAVIAKKREVELARRKAEDAKPIGEAEGTDNLEPVVSLGELIIFKRGGKFFLFNTDNIDNEEFVQYADREESFLGRDEDGEPMVDYGEWDLTDDIAIAYVDDNLQHLNIGKGLDDFEDGYELVEIDSELGSSLLGLRRFYPEKGEIISNVVKSIGVEETTSTGGVGGSYVGRISSDSIGKNNVASEMESIVEIDNEDESVKSEIVSILQKLLISGEDSPEIWLSYGDSIKHAVDLIQKLDDAEWSQLLPFIVKSLQNAELFNSGEIQDKSGYIDNLNTIKRFINHFSSSLSETTTSTSVGGDSGTFMFDVPMGNGSDFWTKGNDMNKKTVKEDAQKDTQYPKGQFVEFDKCTKFNNNKTAQNGGCSAGAVDKVIKTKSSKNSVISDSALYLEVAKATGKTIDEVKTIIQNKINQST